MPHLKFEFLKPDKIKDAEGHFANHPEYDSRTLLVPDNFMKAQTPGHKQWYVKSVLPA
jgi:DNA mismatch repair protein MSH6